MILLTAILRNHCIWGTRVIKSETPYNCLLIPHCVVSSWPNSSDANIAIHAVFISFGKCYHVTRDVTSSYEGFNRLRVDGWKNGQYRQIYENGPKITSAMVQFSTGLLRRDNLCRRCIDRHWRGQWQNRLNVSHLSTQASRFSLAGRDERIWVVVSIISLLRRG